MAAFAVTIRMEFPRLIEEDASTILDAENVQQFLDTAISDAIARQTAGSIFRNATRQAIMVLPIPEG